jgi:ActR/RegA family two-component response regulator
VRLLKRRRIDLALIDLHLGLDHGLDLVQYAAAAGVACIAVTGYPLEATQASDRLLGCLPKPAAGEQIAELVGWFEGACAGSREAPPSTFMFFGATLPPMPMIHRSAQGASRARPATMPKRIRRSLT